jgi:hypothetical protein
MPNVEYLEEVGEQCFLRFAYYINLTATLHGYTYTRNRKIYGQEFAGLNVLFTIQFDPSHSKPFKIPQMRVNYVIIIP